MLGETRIYHSALSETEWRAGDSISSFQFCFHTRVSESWHAGLLIWRVQHASPLCFGCTHERSNNWRSSCVLLDHARLFFNDATRFVCSRGFGASRHNPSEKLCFVARFSLSFGAHSKPLRRLSIHPTLWNQFPKAHLCIRQSLATRVSADWLVAL